MSKVEQAVQAVLDEFIESEYEVGLQAAAYINGELAVDCTAGVIGRDSEAPVASDTLFTIASCSKGVALTGAHILAERGLIDYRRPLAEYWPDFAAHGKERVTVAQALNHLAGIPQTPVVEGLPFHELLCRTDLCIAETARLQPMFEPGTTACYHGLTIGWILEALVRSVADKSVSRLIRDEITQPLGIENELMLGTPTAFHGRMAAQLEPPVDVEKLPAPDPIFFKILPVENESVGQAISRPEVRQAEVAAANISATARALAKHYAALVSDVEGCRLLSSDRIELLYEFEANLPDEMFNRAFPVPQVTPRILGYQRNTGDRTQEFYYGPNLKAFGHGGYGGSCGLLIPKQKSVSPLPRPNWEALSSQTDRPS
jgi:CubicO group peptidase (beta-lactamase class C family)